MRRDISLGFDLRAGVTVKREKPWFINSSAEVDNKLTPSLSHGCVIFEAQHSRAVSVQGVSPRPARIEQGRKLVHEFSLNPGETRMFHYLNLIGEDKDATLDAYDRQQADFERLLVENEDRRCAGILRSAFTPGNSEFSGHLPELITCSPELWRIYYVGLTNILINRRVSGKLPLWSDLRHHPSCLPSPLSHVTGTPCFATSLSLSLLDPQALRRLLRKLAPTGHALTFGHGLSYGSRRRPLVRRQ